MFEADDGGSLRFRAGHEGTRAREARVDALLAEEAAAGLHTTDYFAAFMRQVARTKQDLLAHLVDFRRYFWRELAELAQLADDGLVELAPEWIVVTPRGRLLVRAICMVFDRYLRERRAEAAYSKVI